MIETTAVLMRPAQDDRELAEADEATTDVCGGNLRDVAGGNRGCRAEADAANDAGQEQEGVAEAAQEGRDGPEEGLEKQEGADPHERGLTADLVGDASRGEGADQAADDTCRARNTLQDRAELEGGSDGLDGGVEDHALESVEEGAEGGDQGESRCVVPCLLLAGCECGCRCHVFILEGVVMRPRLPCALHSPYARNFVSEVTGINNRSKLGH